MTEEEWLTCDMAAPLWELVKEDTRWTPRTLRLFVCAFWGWQAERLKGNSRIDLRQRVKAFEKWAETGKLAHRWHTSSSTGIVFFNACPVAAVAATIKAPGGWGKAFETSVGVMPNYIRCIFGNPFRPVGVDPEWLTSTVSQLAQGIYDDRAVDRLPILADALQDAGCDNADVLNHCRDNGPHARGCWVVDLVLGKT